MIKFQSLQINRQKIIRLKQDSKFVNPADNRKMDRNVGIVKLRVISSHYGSPILWSEPKESDLHDTLQINVNRRLPAGKPRSDQSLS